MADKNKSTVERLNELKQLYDAGLLTETEMEAVKAEILGEVDIQQNEGERQNIKQPINRLFCAFLYSSSICNVSCYKRQQEQGKLYLRFISR